MTVRRPLAVANWKMNGSLALVEEMSLTLNEMSGSIAEVVVCPPYPFITALSAKSNGFQIGAQNLSQHQSGAHTGEIAGSMLKALNVNYVIVGHSERRAMYGENDGIVAQKFAAAIQAGLKPILCVGESIEQKEAGLTESVVASQVEAVLKQVGVEKFEHAVIAYEPIWAIGTGKTATAEAAQQVHRFIRALVGKYDEAIAQRLPILYGGSVNAGNSAELFAQPDIDGGLVGGASLDSKAFAAICNAF